MFKASRRSQSRRGRRKKEMRTQDRLQQAKQQMSTHNAKKLSIIISKARYIVEAESVALFFLSPDNIVASAVSHLQFPVNSLEIHAGGE
jgi:hypothetical protein